MTLRGVRAFAVMELLAQTDLEGGRWEKDAGGYRLVGRIPGHDGGGMARLALLFGFAGVLLLVTALAVFRPSLFRRAGRQLSASASPGLAGGGEQGPGNQTAGLAPKARKAERHPLPERPAVPLKKQSKRKGFTLVEFLLVVAIMGALVGLLLPAVQKARAAALAARCGNNLRQLGLACHACHDALDRLPPAWGWFPDPNLSGGSAGVGPLFFHLLPFLEQGDLYRSSRQGPPPLDYYNYQVNVNTRQVKAYTCPLDPTLPAQGGAPGVQPYAASSYAANFQVFGVADAAFAYVSPFGRPSLARSFPDGVSHTLLFAEKYAVADVTAANSPGGQGWSGGCHWAYWGDPAYAAFFALYEPGWTGPSSVGPQWGQAVDGRDSRFQVPGGPAAGKVDPGRCASGHAGAMNVCLADGSVRPLAAGMDRYAWWAAVTPAGGEAGE
jgi:prepilin-type N-terminal cleavage/methylation domain-containing protein/prepilin-type processing-associated H-X9-DG protein